MESGFASPALISMSERKRGIEHEIERKVAFRMIPTGWSQVPSVDYKDCTMPVTGRLPVLAVRRKKIVDQPRREVQAKNPLEQLL